MKTMLMYVEEKHAGQKRQDGTPASLHAKRTAIILEAALIESGEAPRRKIRNYIHDAALGHDLLEDTDAQKLEISAIAGAEALRLIEALTNTWGDDHTTEYVEKVLSGPEIARLIKLADLTDNIMHASYSSKTLGKKWVLKFFVPIVEPMADALKGSFFVEFPKTASLLHKHIAIARAHLNESILAL